MRRRHDLFAVALLFVFCTIPFADVIFGGQRFYIRDLTRYYYPTKQLIRDVILQGEMPYWNRHYSAGQPMAANPEYEVFYPLQHFILLPDYDTGYQIHILIHIYIAALGMYALLRSMRLRIPAAFFGALIFTLGGFYISLINLLPILFCAAWVPLILLFARRFFLSPNIRDFSLAAFFLGMEGLVGEPTTILQTWFLVACYGGYRAVRSERPWKTLFRNAALCIALVSIGVLAGAAQLVPAVDHAKDSVRARPFPYDLVTSWSMPYARPLELVYPSVFGHIWHVGRAGTFYWGAPLYRNTASPFIFSIYPGLLAAALLIAGLIIARRGWWLVLAVCAASVFLALGEHNPVYKLLYDLGVARSIRYPEKFSFIAAVAIVLFASKMLDRILAGDRELLKVTIQVVIATTVIAGLLTIFFLTPWYAPGFKALWGLKASAVAQKMVTISGRDWMIATARGFILLTLLLFFDRRRSRLALGALAAFVLVDIGAIGFEVNPRMPKGFYTEPQAAKNFPEPREGYRLFHEVDWYGGSEPGKSYFNTGRHVYWIVRNGLFPMTEANWRIETVLERDYDKTALLPTVDLVAAMWHVRDSGQKRWAELFMSMSNARYRAKYRPFEEEKKRVKGNFSIAQPIDFVPVETNERYYFADSVVSTPDLNAFMKRLTEGNVTQRFAMVAMPEFEPAAGKVIRWSETPNTATIEVEADGKSYLVMSVTPHKYWTATIDGKPVPLHVTNIAYQGIVVPPGRHTIRMVYKNTLVPPALTASILSMLGLLAGGLFVPKRDLGGRPFELSDEAPPSLLASSEPQPDSSAPPRDETLMNDPG